MRKVIVILLAFSILIVGCSNPHSEGDKKKQQPQVITLWSVETGNKKYIEDAIKKFNDEHKDLQIKAEFYDDETLKIKIKVAVIGNKLPDIFSYWTGEKFKTMVEAGMVGDITKQINEDPKYKEEFSPGGLDAFSYKGKVYGIPFGPSAVVLWYNKEIFDKYGLKAPKTYNDLLIAIDKFNANHVIPITVAGKERWPILHWFSYLAQRIGGEDPFIKVVNGEADFTDPSFVEAGKKLQELAITKKGFINGFLGLDYAAAESNFVEGKAAMYLQGEWAIQAFVKDKTFSEKVGFVPFPTVSGGKGSSGTFQGGVGVGYILSSKTDKTTAYRVLKGIVNPGQRKKITEFDKLTKKNESITNRFQLSDQFFNYINKNAKGFFGYYDQQLDPIYSERLLNSTTKIAGNSNVDVSKELESIR